MATILVEAGRAAVAAAVKDKPLHLAWGSGNAGWDTTPVAAPTNATALVAEIGRRAAAEVQFVTPDEEGDIEVPPGKFSVSLTPTKYLYCRFVFDFGDAPSANIREVATFSGTVLEETVPEGQLYVEPDEVADPGVMLTLERFYRVERSNSIRQRFEYVIQF